MIHICLLLRCIIWPLYQVSRYLKRTHASLGRYSTRCAPMPCTTCAYSSLALIVDSTMFHLQCLLALSWQSCNQLRSMTFRACMDVSDIELRLKTYRRDCTHFPLGEHGMFGMATMSPLWDGGRRSWCLNRFVACFPPCFTGMTGFVNTLRL
jgi:hypothetical protein